jgi:glycosyltransferase involved in cell wall biosynthesis
VRIAQFLSRPGLNGATAHCLLLTRQLSARGHKITLFYGARSPVSVLAGAQVETIETSMRKTPAELRRVWRLMQERRIEVVHTHMSAAHAYGALFRIFGGMPTVATSHTRLFQLHWKCNDRVIALCQSTSLFHQRVNLVQARRISVLPGFLDISGYPQVTPAQRGRAKAALGLPPEAFVVGSVGSLIARKCQSDLVEAIGRLLQIGIPAYLVLVGRIDAEEGRRVGDRIAEFGLERNVILTNGRSDVPSLLRAFDVYAQSSVHEEFPVAVLEAMAVGLPIVATDVGGMPDLVADGESGYLVPTRSPQSIVDALIRLAREAGLRMAMGEESRRRVMQSFTAEEIIPRIETVLAEAAAEARRHQEIYWPSAR